MCLLRVRVCTDANCAQAAKVFPIRQLVYANSDLATPSTWRLCVFVCIRIVSVCIYECV